MSAVGLVIRARSMGLVLRPDGDRLVVYPRDLLTDDFRAALIQGKPGIIEFLDAEIPAPEVLPPDLREEYEERAAIIEVMNEVPRSEAERRAWWIVIAKVASGHTTPLAPLVCPQCGRRSESALRGLSCSCGHVWRVAHTVNRT